LQDKKCIRAYLFSLGLDDQDPSQWDDAELSHLVVPEVGGFHRTARRRRGKKRRRRRRRISEEEEEAQPTCRILWILILTIHRTSRRRRGKRRRRRSSSSSSLPSMTRHGKNPGDRR
jgi:hypothetical protein